ncbi:hypothetical protein [Mucilaginibacter gilvus]|nr:hypothetical protein [Mucilaginibacter gilvus]
MRKICLAALILLSGIITSCIKSSTVTAMDVFLKPSVGVRKDIGTAD